MKNLRTIEAQCLPKVKNICASAGFYWFLNKKSVFVLASEDCDIVRETYFSMPNINMQSLKK